jgi:hypothetical protein
MTCGLPNAKSQQGIPGLATQRSYFVKKSNIGRMLL